MRGRHRRPMDADHLVLGIIGVLVFSWMCYLGHVSGYW